MADNSMDRKYMQRCLELAGKGLGHVAPNPMVGCVIVAGGKIIGEGYHREFGTAHAEVNAIASVDDVNLLKKASLYVNLEPCSHHGKTPPCSTLIREHHIPEVIMGSIDPNALVAGKGRQDLEAHGVKVRSGILEEECRELNRRFFTFHEKKRPYVILKWAQTGDGFIDILRSEEDPGGIHWITDNQARQWVHKWRSEEQSILVGTNTAAIDDPELTVRDWQGKNPLRLVVDMKGRLPRDLRLFDGSTPTLVFAGKKKKNLHNVEFVQIPDKGKVIPALLKHLYSIDIQSIIVEGGAALLGSFIENATWDEARVFTSRSAFGKGLKAPVIDQNPCREIPIPCGTLKIYRKS